MNKFILTILLLLTVISLGSLGFFAMGHHADHDGCIAAVANNVGCAASVSGLQFVAFHLNAFKSFTLGLVNNILIATFFLFALVFAGIFVLFKNRYLELIQKNHFKIFRYSLELSIVFLEYKLIRWLAIHENSPSSA